MSDYHVRNRMHQAADHLPDLSPALGPRETRKISKKIYDKLIPYHHAGKVILFPNPDLDSPEKEKVDEPAPPVPPTSDPGGNPRSEEEAQVPESAPAKSKKKKGKK